MPTYAVQYAYRDVPEQLDEHRPVHRDWLRGLAADGAVVTCGPWVGEPAGALLIFRGESAAAVETLLDQDPFWTVGVIAERSVREWNPVIGQLAD
ncbi:YciI family protein [Nakamurella leprariae]|uniref:YCII-related domain-containing protein n=1 Tax=Nakamurella leprariae TaxID=2803911 RepID=A0A938YJY5_9ACTN|nr:YciI family protein [Nakamurella leprariae]MBM9469544.1 hypothetical protein [Nakamurella leprariae]